MKHFFLIFLILLSNMVVAQKMNLTDSGINDIVINSNINEFSNSINWLQPIKNYIDREKVRFGSEDKYNYYFFNLDSIVLINIGDVKDIFVATDSSGKILKLTIFLKNESESFVEEINKVYKGKPLLASSGIGNTSTNILMNWIKGKMVLNYRKNITLNFSKITINDISREDDFSHISIQ